MIRRMFGCIRAVHAFTILAFAALLAPAAQAEDFLDPVALRAERDADASAFMQKYNGQTVAVRGQFLRYEAGEDGYVALDIVVACRMDTAREPLLETLEYGDWIVARGTVDMESVHVFDIRPCTIELSPTDMTGRTPPPGYYACGSRYGFYPEFSFTLLEGGIYEDTEGGRGAYSYDPATQIVLLQGGKFDGFDLLFTAEPVPMLTHRDSAGGFDKGINCPNKG